jgi:hypothetical protein
MLRLKPLGHLVRLYFSEPGDRAQPSRLQRDFIAQGGKLSGARPVALLLEAGGRFVRIGCYAWREEEIKGLAAESFLLSK